MHQFIFILKKTCYCWQTLHQISLVSSFIEIKLWVKEEFLEWVKKKELCGRLRLALGRATNREKSTEEWRPEEKTDTETKEKTKLEFLYEQKRFYIYGAFALWLNSRNVGSSPVTFPRFFFLYYFSSNKAFLKHNALVPFLYRM